MGLEMSLCIVQSPREATLDATSVPLAIGSWAEVQTNPSVGIEVAIEVPLRSSAGSASRACIWLRVSVDVTVEKCPRRFCLWAMWTSELDWGACLAFLIIGLCRCWVRCSALTLGRSWRKGCRWWARTTGCPCWNWTRWVVGSNLWTEDICILCWEGIWQGSNLPWDAVVAMTRARLAIIIGEQTLIRFWVPYSERIWLVQM